MVLPFHSLRWLSVFTSLAFAGGAICAADAPTRHLFLDPAFLVESKGVTLTVNPPSAGERVLQADKPWEDFWLPFYSTVRDENGKLRMWYNCRDQAGRTNVAYAESVDGVNWTKPNLGVYEYLGSKENNLVGLNCLEGAVYRDPKGSGDQQYVYLASLHKQGGIFRFTSPDGLRWKRDAVPLLPFECDTQNVAFWDEPRNKYSLYLRGWGPKTPRNNRRKLVRVDADQLGAPVGLKPAGLPYHASGDKDRQPWIDTEAPTVLACDDSDAPNLDIYTSAIQPYPLDPRWYVGFPAFLRHYVNSPQPITDGWTEVQFIGSRDGLKFQRYDRRTYAGPGLPGDSSGSMIYMGVGLVVRGDEIWQYGTRYRTTHGDIPGKRPKNDGALYRFVQRIDGFVSADFPANGGTARTEPVTIDGARLLVNLDAGALGELRVGLLEANGQPVAGFGLEDCDLLRMNSTKREVTWKGQGDLRALQGRDVRVVLSGARAKLYSFFFSNDAP